MALFSILPSVSSSPPPTTALLPSRNCSSSSPSASGRILDTGLFNSSPIGYNSSIIFGHSSRRSLQVVRMAPDEEKMTRRSPLDFPIEWERPKPGRRPDIFPQFSPMKTPLPPPMPADPPEEDEEEEEKKEEEEDPEKEEDPNKPEQ